MRISNNAVPTHVLTRQDSGTSGSYSSAHFGGSRHSHESAHPGQEHDSYWESRRAEIRYEHLKLWGYHRENPMGSPALHGQHEMALLDFERHEQRWIDEAEATEHMIGEDKLHVLRNRRDGQFALDVCIKAYTGEQFDTVEARDAANLLDNDRKRMVRHTKKEVAHNSRQAIKHRLTGDQFRYGIHKSKAEQNHRDLKRLNSPDHPHRVVADKLRGYAGQPGYEHHGPPPYTYRDQH